MCDLGLANSQCWAQSQRRQNPMTVSPVAPLADYSWHRAARLPSFIFDVRASPVGRRASALAWLAFLITWVVTRAITIHSKGSSTGAGSPSPDTTSTTTY